MAEAQREIIVIDQDESAHDQHAEAIETSQDHDADLRSQQMHTAKPMTTFRTFDAFRWVREIAITKPQYISLCAYLCSILKAGFHLHEREIDDFIMAYPEFDVGRKQQQEVVLGSKETSILLISYHKWFEERRDQGNTEARPHILNEEKLREVWSENKYDFKRVEETLSYIIDVSKRRSDWT